MQHSHVAHGTGHSKHKVNERPIIGIITQPGMKEDTFIPKNHTYIAASYVKFVEGGGARAVPILQDTPKEQVWTQPDGLGDCSIKGMLQVSASMFGAFRLSESTSLR